MEKSHSHAFAAGRFHQLTRANGHSLRFTCLLALSHSWFCFRLSCRMDSQRASRRSGKAPSSSEGFKHDRRSRTSFGSYQSSGSERLSEHFFNHLLSNLGPPYPSRQDSLPNPRPTASSSKTPYVPTTTPLFEDTPALLPSLFPPELAPRASLRNSFFSSLDSDSEDERFAADEDDAPSRVPSSAPQPTMPLFTSLAALLAPGASSPPLSLDHCFCGKLADDDSIYCSVACGRSDAMQALCGDENAPKSKRTSSGASHYRRVGQAEAKREQERQKEKDREKEQAASRMGAWRFNSSSAVGSTSMKKKPSTSSSHSNLTPLPSSLRRRTPPSRAVSPAEMERSDSRSTTGTGHSSVPSLSSSSVASHSTCDSELPSPSSPYFPSTPNAAAECLSPFLHFDPASPQPTICATEDIYRTYLTLTPTAGCASTPNFARLSLGGEGEDNFGLGLGYVTEERDHVGNGMEGQELKERVKSKMPARGHQRQKLSFDDICHILNV